MPRDQNHLSDETLLLAADGELSLRDVAQVGEHIAACWACRARKQELESAVGDFVRSYRKTTAANIPAAAGPRALLKAQMEELSRKQSEPWSLRLRTAVGLAAILAVVTLASALWLGHKPTNDSMLMLPDRTLTPGATVLMSRDEVCKGDSAGNKTVPIDLQREVFRKYGMRSAALRAYEVDYLITPALGGADDIHNLWPEAYSTRWNARVKDQLEDYLRERVCAGTLDLATAQHDLSVNWIDAYKRYFHTDRPKVRNE